MIENLINGLFHEQYEQLQHLGDLRAKLEDEWTKMHPDDERYEIWKWAISGIDREQDQLTQTIGFRMYRHIQLQALMK